MPEVIERIECKYLDELKCPCGNATHLDGFDELVASVGGEPIASGVVRCVTCGRRYDTDTHDGETVGIVKGPDVTA